MIGFLFCANPKSRFCSVSKFCIEKSRPVCLAVDRLRKGGLCFLSVSSSLLQKNIILKWILRSLSQQTRFVIKITIIMYHFSKIASALLLLIASSTALTVVDTKASSIKIQKTAGLRMPAIVKNSNACCPDYPYCGCPKLETPPSAATKAKMPLVIDPAATTQNQMSNACCPNYPYCGCPKI